MRGHRVAACYDRGVLRVCTHPEAPQPVYVGGEGHHCEAMGCEEHHVLATVVLSESQRLRIERALLRGTTDPRDRARRSWSNWDAKEVDRELEPCEHGCRYGH